MSLVVTIGKCIYRTFSSWTVLLDSTRIDKKKDKQGMRRKLNMEGQESDNGVGHLSKKE